MTRPSDTRALLAAALAAALLVCELVAAKAARDALYLGHFGADALPPVMIASSALALGSAFGAAALMRRRGPIRSTVSLLIASAALLLLGSVLFGAATAGVIVALYLLVASLGAALMSGFWSVVTERFDPYSARRAVARIAAAASLGGLVGGLSASPLLSVAGPRVLLAVLGVLHLTAAGLLLPLQTREAPPSLSARGGASVLTRSRYLQSLALLVFVTALGGTLLDYTFKARAGATYGSTEELAAFFGLFYTSSGLASALIQLGFTKRALEGIGLGGTLGMLPLFVLLAGLLALFLPELWPVVVLRGGAQVLENTLFRSAYEPLYTPLAADQKRAVKTVVDVASERLGDLLGAGVVLLAVALLASSATTVTLALSVLVAISAILLSLALHRGYVRELANALRLGMVKLTDADVHDRTTRLTLSQTAMDIDRVALLKEIAELQQRTSASGQTGRRDALSSEPPRPPSRPPSAPPEGRTTLLTGAEALISGEEQRVRALLVRGLEPELVPLALPLLVRDDLVEPLTAALRKVAPQAVGALGDALLDEHKPSKLRRRIPHVLEAARGERAVMVLTAALRQREFDVRYRASLALCSLVQRGDPPPSEHEVYAAVQRELDSRSEADAALDAELDAGVKAEARRLKYVFNLLGLWLGREPMELSLKALGSGDRKLRGTALEYLENVLPAGLKELIWPHLGAPRPAEPPPMSRPRQQIVDELRSSLDGIQFPPAEARTGRKTPV